MDLPLPEGTQANFGAVPLLGEPGVVAFARDIAAYLHRLHRTPTAVRYSEEGPDRLTTRVAYQLDGPLVEVTVHDGDLGLRVDGRAIDLPFSPRDPAWAIAWAVHVHADQDRTAGMESTDRRRDRLAADGT